jgi:predicted component of type VI protein secretion system
MIVRFHVLTPPSKQRSFTARLPLLLGRGEEAKFRIQHDLVSRRHCEFFARDGRVFVHDLGSTNGTFLNDEPVPVSTRTEVRPGAVVRVGGLSFRVDYQLSPAAGTTAPALVADGDESDSSGRDAEESRVAGTADAIQEDAPDFDFVAPPNAETEPLAEPEEADAGREIVVPDPIAADESSAGAALSFSVPDVEPPAEEPWAGLEAARGDSDHDDADDDDSDDGPGDDKLNEFFKGLT